MRCQYYAKLPLYIDRTRAMHLTEEEIISYKDRRLSPDQVLRVRTHSDECSECRARLAGDSVDALVLRTLLSDEPDEQELVLFVAGRLPESRAREIKEHAANCM